MAAGTASSCQVDNQAAPTAAGSTQASPTTHTVMWRGVRGEGCSTATCNKSFNQGNKPSNKGNGPVSRNPTIKSSVAAVMWGTS
jgi:hypothetical protein